MNKELEEMTLKMADYSNEEKNGLIKRMYILFLIGTVAFIVFIVLDMMGLAGKGYTEAIASFTLGFSLR